MRKKTVIFGSQKPARKKTLQLLVGPKYSATSDCKTRARTKKVLNRQNNLTSNCTEADSIIILCGMNNCNVIILEIPHNKHLNEKNNTMKQDLYALI